MLKPLNVIQQKGKQLINASRVSINGVYIPCHENLHDFVTWLFDKFQFGYNPENNIEPS